MSARNNKGKAARSALMATFICAVAIAATAAYVKLGPHRPSADTDFDRPTPVLDHSTPTAKPLRDKPEESDSSTSQSKLQVPVVHGDDVTLASSSETPADGEEPAVFLANQSLKAIHADSAKALSVTVKDRVALIEFNQAIEDGFGSSQEASFIKALQVSLGQLPDVDKFQILVDGQPIESLGHFEVTDPIEVTRSSAIHP